LEYQLELLKRRFGTDESMQAELSPDLAETPLLSLLVYNARGRILRVEIEPDVQVQALGRITDEMINESEPPRLLGVSSTEELILLFTSGRVSTHPVRNLPAVDIGGAWSWEQAALPDEPRAGEWLACITPLSHLPLADFFLQVSRRGCVKKTMTSVAQSILANHYLGKGALQKSDQPFDVSLGQKNDRFAFVTIEGHLVGLDVDGLSYSVEERIRIAASDYVIASFAPQPDESMLFVTQTGKVIHRESNSLELSKSASARGQALISTTRLEQGARFIGAASVREKDRIVVLDAKGNLSIHLAETLTGAGSIEAGGLTGEAVSIGVMRADTGKRANP
jgi:DNA gyrase/topoisomerase IV subunit A